jgi:hypothetical protein
MNIKDKLYQSDFTNYIKHGTFPLLLIAHILIVFVSCLIIKINSSDFEQIRYQERALKTYFLYKTMDGTEKLDYSDINNIYSLDQFKVILTQTIEVNL